MKKIINLKRNADGQSLVEFALVFPLLMILILGMIEFGWILNGKITLTSAAREGARRAVLFETSESASEPARLAVIRSAEGSSLISVNADTNFDETTGSAIVTATASIKPIIGLFFKSDVNLTAKAEMKIE